MLTRTEESKLEFILGDLRTDFFVSVRKDDYYAIEFAVHSTHESLVKLMDKIMLRKRKL